MTQRTSDTIAYRVTGPDGAFVTGLHGIPPIPGNRTLEGGVPIFYNAVFEREPVRMVALSFFIEHPDFEGWVLVQVLQTMGERHAMPWYGRRSPRSGLRLILAVESISKPEPGTSSSKATRPCSARSSTT